MSEKEKSQRTILAERVWLFVFVLLLIGCWIALEADQTATIRRNFEPAVMFLGAWVSVGTLALGYCMIDGKEQRLKFFRNVHLLILGLLIVLLIITGINCDTFSDPVDLLGLKLTFKKILIAAGIWGVSGWVYNTFIFPLTDD